ncbi:uncharacterized protein Dsimw501_GD27311 [Drosophila simulans]|nr:uncharacterized protein Dsimw501_GD27311 [Drosophila simulans]
MPEPGPRKGEGKLERVDNPSQDLPRHRTLVFWPRLWRGSGGSGRKQSWPRCGLTYPAASEVYQKPPRSHTERNGTGQKRKSGRPVLLELQMQSDSELSPFNLPRIDEMWSPGDGYSFDPFSSSSRGLGKTFAVQISFYCP